MSGGSFDRDQDVLPDALRVGAAAPFRVEDLLGVVGQVLGRLCSATGPAFAGEGALSAVAAFRSRRRARSAGAVFCLKARPLENRVGGPVIRRGEQQPPTSV